MATHTVDRIARPLHVWRSLLRDPVRTVQMLLTVVVLGYGARQDNRSPFTIGFMENVIGSTFSGVEVAVVVIVALEIVRRIANSDSMLNRSPLTRPMLAVALVLAVVPFVRMLVWENALRFPLELTGFPVLVGCYFLYVQMFRRREVGLMAWILVAAGLYKAVEGVAIYGTVGLGWGLLTGWRDAALLAFMLLGATIAWIIQPGTDRTYRNIRRALFVCAPIVLFTFTNSTRRSYVIGVCVALGFLLFYLNKREMARMGRAVPILVVTVLAAAVLTGTTQFVDRMSVLSNPASEGSAAYRLIEVYNITQEIVERPLFGYPFGWQWRNYTSLEFENISLVMPHNTYLYAAWRGGAVGLAAWLWLLAALFRLHHRAVRGATTPMERFLALWTTSFTASIVIAGLTMPITADHLQTFFPFVAALASLLPGTFGSRRVATNDATCTSGVEVAPHSP